ncbi:MAG: hypothetical protein RLY93_17000 [Sumerlaeia bacterium]
MKTESGLEATREIRKRISAENHNDPRQLCDYYREYQSRFAERLKKPVVRSEKPAETEERESGN